MRKNCNYMQYSYCKNNITNSCTNNNDITEDDSCPATLNISDMMPEKCECGYDTDSNGLPENPVLAQSYVPIQEFGKTFPCETALKMGTLFPELVSPYCPGQSICEINKIKALNKKGVCGCGNM